MHEVKALAGERRDGGRDYHCGTLTYTKLGLGALFAWLLWGDFCFQLMETVAPSVLPLKLKALGASNTLMSVIMTTLPGILNMTICPWVSFKSDRYRGRWGRRLPFILWTMPFLTLSLILLGWSEEIARAAQHVIPSLAAIAPATVTIGVIAGCLVLFQLFNMFVNSVFWYLFNDVVPPQFLGRFMGLFRIVGTAASSFYSYFIFKHAETHMREILTGGALLYFIGFGAMCLFVKEGKYPPPPSAAEEPPGLKGMFKSFGKQAFSSKFYWYFYLMNAFGSMAGACAFAMVFFNKQMGLTLEQMGKLAAYGGIAALVATYFTAIFVDRWHPLRISTYMAIVAAVTGFGSWVWISVTLPAELYFWLALGGMLVGTFSSCLRDACDMPLFMRLMPGSLYGQFCSANAIVRSFARIAGGLMAGPFLDFVTWLNRGSDVAYRWLFVWPWACSIISTVFICLGYREWKRLGGDDGYRPPTPWTATGYEEVADKVKSVPPVPRLVMLSQGLGLAGIAINLLMVAVFMVFMRRHELMHAFWWHVHTFIPAMLGLSALGVWQYVSIRRDVRAVRRGDAPRLGIPHHGVFLVNAIQGLVAFPIYWMQTAWMIRINMERELIIFGTNMLLMTLAGIVGVLLIRWLEHEPAASVTPIQMNGEGVL